MTMQAPAKIRLYVAQDYAEGQPVTLSAGQSHYLAQVMRLREGDAVALFNGQQGEWRALVALVEKKTVTLTLAAQLAAFRPVPDLWLAFAPIRNKSELVVEKAVELGVRAVLPVFTRHAVVKSVNEEKLRAHAIEAAEQCGRHDVPELAVHKDLPAMLAQWPAERLLLYGDESGHGAVLNTILSGLPPAPYAILIGPEGGFSSEEHQLLRQMPFVRPFGLGPRILRADTAAVAALACLQAWRGDWEQQPHFAA